MKKLIIKKENLKPLNFGEILIRKSSFSLYLLFILRNIPVKNLK
jgi:hypothetical protein